MHLYGGLLESKGSNLTPLKSNLRLMLKISYAGCRGNSPGNSPGAAAPTLVVLKSPIVDRCRSEVVQLIGLVDYPSLKKSIWCRRLLSRRPLNALTDVASTSSWHKLFQRLMTRCEKNWRRASQWQWFFNNFQLWPLVTMFSDLWKNSFHGVPEKPLTNLKSSMRSVMLRLS